VIGTIPLVILDDHRGDGLHRFLPASGLCRMQGDQLQGMRGAKSHAGRFETLVNAIHAVVALDRLFGVGIELGRVPGADFRAGHAPDTFLLLDINNPVSTFFHGIRGADRHAERILAVVA